MPGVANTPALALPEEPAQGTPWGSSGRYVIDRQLGSGGMGTVYAATDTLLGRRVALKVLHRWRGDDAPEPSRILHEARLAARVEHERIARVYDVDKHEGMLFVAMEFVRGVTLRTRMNASPLDGSDIVTIAVQIAEGLAELHACGLIHRDLKPENVMLSDAGCVKLLDFGLARQVSSRGFDADSPSSGRSPSEHLLSPAGTPGYMAPERFEGGALNYRVDVFALGVIVYELVTRVRPFADAGSFHRDGARFGTPDFSSRRWSGRSLLKQTTAQMLAGDPLQRIADGAQALAALRRVALRSSGVYLRSPSFLPYRRESATDGSSIDVRHDAPARGDTEREPAGRADAHRFPLLPHLLPIALLAAAVTGELATSVPGGGFRPGLVAPDHPSEPVSTAQEPSVEDAPSQEGAPTTSWESAADLEPPVVVMPAGPPRAAPSPPHRKRLPARSKPRDRPAGAAPPTATRVAGGRLPVSR